jgi:Protein of unknown function (DUF3795)
MDLQLIAPCGMYCGLCSSYLAYLNQVPRQRGKFTYCTGCRPRGKQCAWVKKHCEYLQNHTVQYCYECPVYPCEVLEHLSTRYRTRYGLDFLENQAFLRDRGEQALLDALKERYACEHCGGLRSIHSGMCFSCDDIHSWRD